jgi:endonuclease/exonuclease/phosphatase family metal-dependent hydrolase
MMITHHGDLRDMMAHDSPLSRRASDHLPIKATLHLGAARQRDLP